MNILQIGFVVRSGLSALVIAFLLSYEAHHEWDFLPLSSGLARCWLRYSSPTWWR
jgi:hypothetical protein